MFIYQYLQLIVVNMISTESHKKKSLITNRQVSTYVQSSTRSNFSDEVEDSPAIQKRKRYLYRQFYFLKGFLGCLGGLMIHLVIGSLYQWGLLNPYMTSYFYLEGYINLTTQQMSFVFPLMMFCIGLTMWIGIVYGERIGFSNICLITFAAGSVCVFISSFFTNLIGFVIFYVIGFGLAAGVAFLVPMRVCNDYFPNKQTYVNGFILIGSGLGSVVFGSIAINYMNPDHQATIDSRYTDQSLQHIPERAPACIKLLSLLYFVVGSIGSLLLRPLQNFNHTQTAMEKTIISKTLVKKNQMHAGYCLTPKQAICSQIFWVNVILIILGCCGNILMNTNYRMYASHKLYNDEYLNLVGLVGSSANGLSRYFWSALFNRIGFKLIMTIILTINILTLATVEYTVQIQAMYLIDFIIFNTTLGGMMVLAPTFSTLIFGKQVGPRVFGIFWCSFAVGNFIQYTYIMTLSQKIGIDGIILICIGMNLINLIIIVSYRFSGPWKNDLKYFRFSALPKYELVKDECQLLVQSVISNRKKSVIVSSFAYRPESVVYS